MINLSLIKLFHLPEEAKCLMDEFWPGPISFILPLRQGYLCEKVTGGLQSIAGKNAKSSNRKSYTSIH